MSATVTACERSDSPAMAASVARTFPITSSATRVPCCSSSAIASFFGVIRFPSIHDEEMLSERISSLTEHLKLHQKDFASRCGLLMMVGQRRRLLDYVRRCDESRYQSLIERLGLRR